MSILKRKSLCSTVLALLALTAQLAFATAGSIADAREPNSVRVHFDGPRQHHASHNPETCALCLAINSAGVPIAGGISPVASSEVWQAPSVEANQSYSFVRPSFQIARAPPRIA